MIPTRMDCGVGSSGKIVIECGLESASYCLHHEANSTNESALGFDKWFAYLRSGSRARGGSHRRGGSDVFRLSGDHVRNRVVGPTGVALQYV